MSDSPSTTEVHLVVLGDRRPRTRGECINGPRPCPWIGCRYHLGTEVHDGPRVGPGAEGGARYQYKGRIKPNPLATLDEDGDPDPLSLEHTCALDVADQGEHTLEEIAVILGISREWVRRIEDAAVPRLRMGLRDYEDHLIEEPEVAVAPRQYRGAP